MIDFKKELFSNAYKKRIPLTVTIEIVSQCNFRCIHCYIDDTCRKNLLSYEEVVDFGNKIVKMGCLYVVLTGGEVLLHPDFERIYLYFIKLGVCVSVFTNGSLITPKIIEMFKKYPPRIVEITLYGFHEDTYKAVTGATRCNAVKDNIILLKKNNINVMLKMFILKENFYDFDEIRNFALENNIPFKYDYMIIAPAGTEAMKYQISNEQIMHINRSFFSTTAKYNEKTYQYIMGERNERLFLCGAGRNSCWLKSNNCLRMCNFLDCVEFDLNQIQLEDAWNLMAQYIDMKVDGQSKCSSCALREYCDYCPAKSYAMYNNLNMQLHPDIYCKVAQKRICLRNESDG